MHYLYSESIAEDIILLEGDEARHASVLRLKVDEKIGILDGKGRIAIGTAEEGRKIFRVNVHHIEYCVKQAFNLHIAIAPTRQIDRFEWFLEKAAELGVGSITPLICDHHERERLNPDRLRKIIIAAIKQSGRPWLPQLNPPTAYDVFLEQAKPGNSYLAHPAGTLISQLIPSIHGSESICICIGPEGDFSVNELLLADRLKIPRISFGPYRLRTETAGILAAAYFTRSND